MVDVPLYIDHRMVNVIHVCYKVNIPRKDAIHVFTLGKRLGTGYHCIQVCVCTKRWRQTFTSIIILSIYNIIKHAKYA